MGFGRSLRRGAKFLLGLQEDLKEGWDIPLRTLGGGRGGADCSSLGPRRSIRRGGELLLGLWEELKEGWRLPPWALGGA